MRKLLAVLLFAIPTFAQTHSVSLSFNASTTPGVSTYNIYRALGVGSSCAAPTQCVVVGTIPASGPLVFVDLTVVGGTNYSYFATAVCPAAGCGGGYTGESGFSNSVSAVVPGTPPAPPTNLSITSIARTISNGTTTIVASWQDKPNVKTAYTLATHTQYLKKGTLSNSSGLYTTSWSGKLSATTAAEFTVCDASGACLNEKI